MQNMLNDMYVGMLGGGLEVYQHEISLQAMHVDWTINVHYHLTATVGKGEKW